MTFIPNINCVYYIFGSGNCSNKNIKRGWLGIKPRRCVLVNSNQYTYTCNFQQHHSGLTHFPPPPPPKK